MQHKHIYIQNLCSACTIFLRLAPYFCWCQKNCHLQSLVLYGTTKMASLWLVTTDHSPWRKIIFPEKGILHGVSPFLWHFYNLMLISIKTIQWKMTENTNLTKYTDWSKSQVSFRSLVKFTGFIENNRYRRDPLWEFYRILQIQVKIIGTWKRKSPNINQEQV